MLQFPRFRFSPRRRQTSQKQTYHGFRKILAGSLVALLYSASFNFGALARSTNKSGESQTYRFVTQRKPSAAYPIRAEENKAAELMSAAEARFESHANKEIVSLTSPETKIKGFVLRQINGVTECDDATPEETRELEKIDRSIPLHQINHFELLKPAKPELAHASSGENSATGLTIILRATPQLESQPNAAQVKAAFTRAAAVWEQQIISPITIYIDIDYGPKRFGQAYPSANILGSTGGPIIAVPYSSVHNRLITTQGASEAALYSQLPPSAIPTDGGDAGTMWVPGAIARALGGLGLSAEQPQPATPVSDNTTSSVVNMGFNSAFQFDFDPTDGGGCNNSGIDCGKTDFDAVAVHEIGHALGFSSNSGGSGGTPPPPMLLDLFRFRPGVTMGTFQTAQRIVTTGGTQVYFSGGSELALSTGGPSGSEGDGQQSSHWKDVSQNGGVYIGIMAPRIPSGTRRQITANDVAAMDSFGYTMNGQAAPPPPPPPPPAPANDQFANAQIISGCSGSVTGTNISATKELGEPSHEPNGDAGGSSVWYQWQAIVSGSVTITTAGSNYDTMLGVYTGNSVSALTAIVKNDDVQLGVITTSSVTFNATAGTIYKIAVDGYDGGAGDIKLNWTASNCQQATTVQLSASSYSAGEGAGHAALTVTRSDSMAAAKVNYTTSDPAGLTDCNVLNGVASSRCDYATSIGTLSFAAGESSKDIFIPVADDAYAEGPESFTLTLSNPTGASLGTISSATITITDNDSVTGINPVDGAPFFVRQQYIDFLGREPDPAGLQGWQDVLRNCGTTIAPPCDRIEVSAGFFRSPEFQDRGYFIYRFYSTVGKIPLYSDFMPDFAKVSGFLSAQQLEDNKVAFINEFMTRSDFQTRYGGITDPTAYVNALLNTVGVTPPASSKQAWITGLSNSSMTRAQVLRSVAESAEVYSKYYNEAFVIMQYFGYLRRSADISYLQWIQTMNQSGDYRTMINGFLNSPEYRKRFGP